MSTNYRLRLLEVIDTNIRYYLSLRNTVILRISAREAVHYYIELKRELIGGLDND